MKPTLSAPDNREERPHKGAEDKLSARVVEIHQEIKSWLPSLNRIAVALYDPETDVLKTFVNSSDHGSPNEHYEAALKDVQSLSQLAEDRLPRTLNDLTVLAKGDGEHTQKILQKGYLSSHTVPIVHNNVFHGFVFFNASETGCFTDSVVYKLGVYAQLVGLLSITEFNAIRTLQAAVKTAREISQFRDEETGGHLTRMANISRVIALAMADSHGLSDEFIEYLFHFAPLHDIGKIAIPDGILLKEGLLTDFERETMQTHVAKGMEIVGKLISGFKMESMPKIDMLQNIVWCHHEAMDGSGYPQGLLGDQIPLEARIIAVADVFDALTSARPYKKAWTNTEALDFLKCKSPKIFDEECVSALANHITKIEEIQKRFHEDMFG